MWARMIHARSGKNRGATTECETIVIKRRLTFTDEILKRDALIDEETPLSQCFGYPRVLGTPVPKTLVFWVSPVGIPKTLIPGARSMPNNRLGQVSS